MKTRIQTNGMNRYLPPASSTPGDSSVVVNLRKRSECLTPTGSPQELYTLDSHERKLVCIHTCYDGEHHITEDNTGLYYEVCVENGPENIDTISTPIFEKQEGETILSTRTIGNTLIVFCPQNTYYLLYKEGEYISLGERPEIPVISFYPQGTYPITTAIDAHDFNKSYTDPKRIDFNDVQYYDAVYYAGVFKCQELAREEHQFIQPILVRYAITLYDGSRLYASAPVMVSQSDAPLQPHQLKLLMQSSSNVCFGTLAGTMVATSYNLMCKIHHIALDNWKDVIRSIDIFVAPEATIFEPDMDVSKSENWLYYSVKKDTSGSSPSYWLIGEPYFSMEEISKRYLEDSLFYKIASFDNWEEWEDDSELEIKSEVRPDQLVHEEVLSVDNTTLLSTGAKFSYIHNKRLHIANLTKTLFPGFPIGLYNVGTGNSPLTAEVYIRTYIKSDRGESQVVWHGESNYFYNQLSPLISYPDSNAYKMEIVAQVSNIRYQKTINLTPSKYENRAEYLSPNFTAIILEQENTAESLSIPSPQNEVYTQPNILRVSEYENPFIFPAEMTYSISNSAITRVASITSALSEGQFGEFSLYLFTEEGIWALKNGDTIVCYETQHQLNRISIPSNSPIVPLENGILFITENGIFAIQGSTMQELLSFDEAVYESLTPITQQGADNELTSILSDTTKLSEFIPGSQVAYNPTEGELICSHPDHSYSIVIHLATLHIYRSTRVFPHIYSDATHLLGQDESGNIYNLSQETFSENTQAIAWISRPITLQPESYQRWREVCWRMAADNGNLRLSVWGGNDAEGEFNLVSRADTTGGIPGQVLMRQTTPPYKYFRLILTGEVSPDFHLSAVDVSALPIVDNRLR